jgi:hypothetical protein
VVRPGAGHQRIREPFRHARLGVLGVYIKGRSREKVATAIGEQPSSLIRDMMKAVVKKK